MENFRAFYEIKGCQPSKRRGIMVIDQEGRQKETSLAQEKGFRPKTLDDLKGQPRIQRQLRVYIKAAQIKHDTLDHVLITGPSGCGKSTCAGIIANEMGKPMKAYSGPAIGGTDDMAEILLGIQEGDIVFIDEAHRLNKKVQEMLFFALENFQADISVDGAPQRIELPHFTCIASTNLYGSLVDAFLNRFPIQLKLESYDQDSMTDIVAQAAKALGIDIDEECAAMVAATTRGIPRNANSYLRRVYDFAIVTNDGTIDRGVVEEAFDFMGINRYGLNIDDMAYLRYLSKNAKASGLSTIALSTGLDEDVIEQKIEPYLLQKQMIFKTPRGRVISDKGRQVVRES